MLKIKTTKVLKGREQGMRRSHSGRRDRGPEMEGVGENAREKPRGRENQHTRSSVPNALGLSKDM